MSNPNSRLYGAYFICLLAVVIFSHLHQWLIKNFSLPFVLCAICIITERVVFFCTEVSYLVRPTSHNTDSWKLELGFHFHAGFLYSDWPAPDRVLANGWYGWWAWYNLAVAGPPADCWRPYIAICDMVFDSELLAKSVVLVAQGRARAVACFFWLSLYSITVILLTAWNAFLSFIKLVHMGVIVVTASASGCRKLIGPDCAIWQCLDFFFDKWKKMQKIDLFKDDCNNWS